MHHEHAQRTVIALGGSAKDKQSPRAVRQAAVAARWPGVVSIAVLVAACAMGLLVAFQQVVDAGVQQAEVRHRAAMAHADAIRHCNHTAGLAQRERCQAQLQASRRTQTTLNTSGVADTANTAPAGR